MPKIAVTAQVENSAKWEKGFRTHGDLFRSQTVTRPIHFAVNQGNEIAICFEPDDLDAFLRVMGSAATADAMDFDGVRRETVKMFVLDKEFKV